ncbi:MAG: pyridoxal-phosphate dependent enzyme [Candidatus Paceibacterota bacterium]
MMSEINKLNVFSGGDAIKKFLNPDHNPPLPLVEIPEALNPFLQDGVHIYAKCMNALPLGNVKSLPAYNMLLEKQKTDGLENIKNIIENSSGNTVFSLSVIGRFFGIEKTQAIVSNEVTWGKLQLLRFFGTEIFVNEEPICPDPNDKKSGIYLAKQIGQKEGWFNPGQYDNHANPDAHTKWTGPQIWEQTSGQISIFCAGLGTTGTILGTSKYLKQKSKSVTTIGAARKPNNPVPGVRTPNLLKEIAFDWKKYVDCVQEVGTQASFEKSLALCRHGLMAGPSAGFALTALLDYLAEKKAQGLLDTHRDTRGKIICVFISPDNPLPYLDEYFEYLDKSNFPKIENEELLINKPEIKKSKLVLPTNTRSVGAQEAYDLLYPISKKDLWQIVNKGEDIKINAKHLLVDVRTDQEFEHFHLPGSIHMELSKISKSISMFKKKSKGKKVIFVCKTGNRSGIATELARTNGIEAFNLTGGVTEWSRLDLPRVRPKVCVDL